MPRHKPRRRPSRVQLQPPGPRSQPPGLRSIASLALLLTFVATAAILWEQTPSLTRADSRAAAPGPRAAAKPPLIRHAAAPGPRHVSSPIPAAPAARAIASAALATGGANDPPTHDAAGNLTYDRVYQYAYDAWNRLTKVTKAYRDAGGDIQLGSVVAEYEYDGLGRRVVQRVKNSADLDCTYRYIYDGQRIVEIRNGSNQIVKQFVWGTQYIDELIQVSLNDDPDDEGEQNCESHYFAIHDSQFNVIGLVDSQGTLVERYDYTPYGQRQVYFSPGVNDPDCHAPTIMSRRWKVGGIDQPWGLCEVGFQGLFHDEHTDLIHNRARTYHPRLGRFLQRDPSGYRDGMNLYAAHHVMHGGLDPWGLETITEHGTKSGKMTITKDPGGLGSDVSVVERDGKGWVEHTPSDPSRPPTRLPFKNKAERDAALAEIGAASVRGSVKKVGEVMEDVLVTADSLNRVSSVIKAGMGEGDLFDVTGLKKSWIDAARGASKAVEAAQKHMQPPGKKVDCPPADAAAGAAKRAANSHLAGKTPVPGTRSTGVARAAKQEVEMVQKTGKGTTDWTPEEIDHIKTTGQLPDGTVGHHVNNVADHPEWAGDPRNVKFVRGQKGNLKEHGGNFQNPTTGPLIDRGQ